MSIRTTIQTLLPDWLRPLLRRGRRQLRWRMAKLRGQVLTRKQLADGLRRSGVKAGDVLLVHSSLSRLGHVEGGPDAVIDALLDVLGPTGTLLMPAYPVVGDWMAYIHSDPLFDPRTAPSSMGKITDVFWRRDGALRSLHPTHSVAALGTQAEYFLSDHEKSPSCCGDPSPFRKLADKKGKILHLGSPFCNTTSMHVVEDVLATFPRKVYLDDMVTLRYLDHDGQERAVPVKLHDPETAATRLEKVPEKEQEIYQYCLARGVVKTSRIGQATVHLIDASGLELVLEDLAAKGITIYA